jgi:hypothetical protein
MRDTRCQIRTSFVQNKPNLHKPRIYPNLFYCRVLRKKRQVVPHKSKPKQTQTKPIRPPFFARYRTPKPKQTQTNPIKPNFPKNPRNQPNLLLHKGLRTKCENLQKNPKSAQFPANLLHPTGHEPRVTSDEPRFSPAFILLIIFPPKCTYPSCSKTRQNYRKSRTSSSPRHEPARRQDACRESCPKEVLY